MLKIQILLQRDHQNGNLLGLPKVEVVCQTVTCKFIKYSSRRDFTKISGRVTKNMATLGSTTWLTGFTLTAKSLY